MVKISDEVKNNKLNGGRAPNGDRLWDCKIEGCNQKNIPTGKLSEHLFAIIHGHRAIFDEENKQGQIEKVTPRGPNNVEHSTKIEHQERKCEFCGDKYTNKVLSMHRKNCNEQGNIFGCPQKDRFYAHGPNGGWAKELADALEKMEAPTDEERAEAIQITTEEGGKMGGVYVRMAKEWLETKDIATAIENWVYSGYARNAKTRQQRHMGNLNVAVQHFLVTRAEAEEARQLEATETPIVVIEGVPIKLAKAVEQALILCRVNPGKNKNTPFQQDIEWEHSKLREFAAKLLFEAFKNPKLVELEQDPEEELPAAETSEDDPAVFPTPIKTANRKKRTSSGGPSHAASFPALDPKRPNFIHPQIDASTSASAPILPSTPTSAFGQLNFIFPSTPSSTSSSKREEELAAENDALKMELNKKNEEIDRKNEEIDRKNEEIDRKNEEIDRKNEEIDRKNEEIDRKNEEMERMKEENERMKEEMKRLRGDY